jgi:hypothetical protein
VTFEEFATVLTNDPHLAEDIVQEVLVKVHRKWRRVLMLTTFDLDQVTPNLDVMASGGER